ncbi:hypothetical protein GWK47_046282 [Chionoecetes opilio]|uniref:Uncharacterized protein n=1 Tax=Chionoecetes opilio TaxID=41210 RepID=A0A8J5CUW9_CHIOP|nr:hypothetical protein GWK47_046282 [Chionoecetes opilio]
MIGVVLPTAWSLHLSPPSNERPLSVRLKARFLRGLPGRPYQRHENLLVFFPAECSASFHQSGPRRSCSLAWTIPARSSPVKSASQKQRPPLRHGIIKPTTACVERLSFSTPCGSPTQFLRSTHCVANLHSGLSCKTSLVFPEQTMMECKQVIKHVSPWAYLLTAWGHSRVVSLSSFAVSSSSVCQIKRISWHIVHTAWVVRFWFRGVRVDVDVLRVHLKSVYCKTVKHMRELFPVSYRSYVFHGVS